MTTRKRRLDMLGIQLNTQQLGKIMEPLEPTVSGPADETSVRQFVNLSKELVSAALSRDFVSVFKKGSEVLSVVADLFGMFKNDENVVFGADVTEAELESLKEECEKCKSLSPSSINSMTGENDVKELDPASIVIIVELVLKVLDWIRKRRNPLVA